MAKDKTDAKAEKILQTYAFPHLGVSVEAESLEVATKMANMHPDAIYPVE